MVHSSGLTRRGSDPIAQRKIPHSTSGPAPLGIELNTKQSTLFTRPSHTTACPRTTRTPLFAVAALKPNQEAGSERDDATASTW